MTACGLGPTLSITPAAGRVKRLMAPMMGAKVWGCVGPQRLAHCILRHSFFF